MHLDLADSLIDDPDFAPFFIQNGCAVLYQARLTSVPGKDWRLEFGIEFLEADETLSEQNPSNARDWQFSSADSRHSLSTEALIVEAVAAAGPFRGSILHYANLDRLHKGLSDLRERILAELGKALARPDAIFEREYAESKAARLPSAEALLEQLCEDWQRRESDPEVVRFLDLPAPGDCPTLH